MSNFVSSLLGPKLYGPYQPNFLEFGGNKLFSIGSAFYNACVLFSPLLIPYCIFSCSFSNYGSLCRTVTTFYAIAFSLRTLGRLTNGEYVRFIELLESAKSGARTAEKRSQLNRYDYQLFAAPSDFVALPSRAQKWYSPIDEKERIPSLGWPMDGIRQLVAWLAANSFGRRMLYPGSMALFHLLMNDQLVEGRRKLREERGGKRNVVQTEEGNKVDTMFVDMRGKSERGDTLVICCEGNAGYYELGVMMVPANLQYSVLGWNLPGFGESTGIPHPHVILSSMEAVMQFAMRQLGFQQHQIVIYAWSIGGFPATWAAANYPQIRALILDASFDSLTPLAIARMPSVLEGLVTFTVQRHLNLPVAKQLNQYCGPIVLIRRWNDEIILTEQFADEQTKRASNRANHLLIELLRGRHPELLRTNADEDCVFEWFLFVLLSNPNAHFFF